MTDNTGSEVEPHGSPAGPLDTASRLDECERRIADAMAVKALAIREIHNDKLYTAAGYERFEDYLQRRWGISRASGYRYLRVAEAIDWLVAKGLVSRVRDTNAPDLPSHMSQRAMLQIDRYRQQDARQMETWDRDRVVAGLPPEDFRPTPTDAIDRARRLLAEPKTAESHNSPYRDPPSAPDVHTVCRLIDKAKKFVTDDEALSRDGDLAALVAGLYELVDLVEEAAHTAPASTEPAATARAIA